MYVQNLGIALTALPSLAYIAPSEERPWSQRAGSESSRCYTSIGSISVPWAKSTSWSTHYIPCVSTLTIVSTVTTSNPSCATTVRNTTAPEVRYISTVTVTTTTTSTHLSVIPTSSGFLPIQSTDPGAAYDEPIDVRLVAERLTATSGLILQSPLRYQQGVRCHQYQSSSCSVFTITSTKTVQDESPMETTATLIICPSATATGITTTTTVTSTYITTTTVWAACATNNFANSLDGDPVIDGSTTDISTDIRGIMVSSAYECCVAAFTDDDIVQIWGFRDSVCEIVYGNQCATQSAANWRLIQGEPAATFGNANCGQFTS